MKKSVKEELILKGFKFFPKTMLKIYYKKIFNQTLNLKKPIYYSEKLQWLKFYYAKNELATIAGDKAGIHSYLKEKKLDFLLVPLFKVYDSIDQIDWEELPSRFVMKKSNSSGMNIIVTNKDESSKDKVLQQMEKWIHEDFGVFGGEQHYKNMDSKIVIEHFIDEIEEDWRIFYLNGRAEMIQISHWIDNNKENYSGHKDSYRSFSDIDGKVRHILPDPGVIVNDLSEGDYLAMPSDFNKMIEYGEIIAKDFPLVRVDYFHSKGKLYIGELTFTPGNGFQKLNEELQLELGNKLELPKEEI